MKIIVTNDDGIDAPGIEVLRRICSRWGDAIIVAPRDGHSGTGHRVTTDRSIPVERIAHDRYCVDGTPADCARISLACLHPDADWLMSGINRGGNLGVDTYISGTVAAAREAALLGYPALAISHYVKRGQALNWEAAESRAVQAIEYALAHAPNERRFWNINLPHPENPFTTSEMVICELDPSALGVAFQKDGAGYRYCGNYHQRPRLSGFDVDQCFSDKISVTLI